MQVVISATVPLPRAAVVAGSVQVTCLAPTLSSIAVTPQNQTLGAGSTLQLAATANYSFGPPQNITSSVTWTSANTGVATVSAGGVVTCVAGANAQ